MTDRRNPRKRLGATASLAAVVLAVAPVHASPHPDHEQGTGRITGIVVDPDGVPAGDICVDAWSDEWGGSSVTDADGAFLIEGLLAGSYIVAFADCAPERRFPNEYFEDAATIDEATPVVVADDEAVKILAQLDTGASIAGTIRDDAGEPAPWVCVTAEPIDGIGQWSSAVADDTGRYTVSGLRGGSYRVSFATCDAVAIPEPVPAGGSEPDPKPASPVPWPGWPYGYLPEHWQDAADAENATPLTVADGESLDGIDPVLDRASGLHVEVLDANGEPATSVCATAYDPTGDAWLASGYGEGWVTLRGLTPGDVTLFVEDCGTGLYENEWYDDAAQVEDATRIEIPSLSAASVTISLADRPLADLAIERLQVQPVRIQTDAGSIPGPGTQRIVRVTARNEGLVDADLVGLVVAARTRSDGARRVLLADTLSLGAGARTTRTIRADFTGMVGDVTIEARTCTVSERDLSDNAARAETYAVVGGTGFGVTPTSTGPRPLPIGGDDGWLDCESLLWWDGPVVQK